jgi:hypothetical protein
MLEAVTPLPKIIHDLVLIKKMATLPFMFTGHNYFILNFH